MSSDSRFWFWLYLLFTVSWSITELMTHGQHRHELLLGGVAGGIVLGVKDNDRFPKTISILDVAFAHGSLYIIPPLFCDSFLLVVHGWHSNIHFLTMVGVCMVMVQSLVVVYLWRKTRYGV